MRKFSFKKLVRDKIVDDMKENGQKPRFWILSEAEYITELKKKLYEEVEEVPRASDGELKSELADIQEIIDNLVKALNIKKGEIKTAQKEKNKKRGSFKKKIYVDFVEVENNFKWLNYYLSEPQKYPEIKQ